MQLSTQKRNSTELFMTEALEQLGEAIPSAANYDIAATMQIIGSAHISLAVALVRQNGEPGDEDKQITITDSATGRKFIICAVEDLS